MKTLLAKWKARNLLIFLFILLTSLFQVTASSMLTELLDTVLTGNVGKVVKIFLLLFCMYLGMFLFEFLYSVMQADVVRRIKLDLRRKVTEHIAGMDYQEFYEQDIGNYVSWYTSDFIQLEQKALLPFYSIQYKACSLVFTFLAIVQIHVIIAGLMTAVGIVLVVSPRLFAGKIGKAAKELSAEQETYTGVMKSTLGGFMTARAFQRLGLFRDKSEQAGQALEDKNYRMSVINVQAGSVLGILNMVGQFSCTAATALLAANQWISYGTVLAVGTLSGLFFNCFQMIVDDVMTLSAGKVFLEKFRFPKRKEDTREELPPVEKGIEMEEISYEYSGERVLDKLSLTFERGKKYALVGPSGCGKSTLLKIMVGYLKDYRGRVLFDGQEQKSYSAVSLGKQIAYIDQNTYLFPGTIRENITLFQDSYTSQEIEEALKDSALEEFLQGDMLDKEVGEEGRNLSGGQRQRVAIARALLRKKSIIIMDEGTSALDKANARRIEESLLKNPKLTVILISHNIQPEIRPFFDEIYQLQKAGA